MLENWGFAGLLSLWMVVVGGTILYYWKTSVKDSALTIIYLLIFSMYYWLGGAIHYFAQYYSIPEYFLVRDPILTLIGLQHSTLALLSFVGANLITTYLIWDRWEAAASSTAQTSRASSAGTLSIPPRTPLDQSHLLNGPSISVSMSSAPALYLLSGISSFLLLQFTFIGGLPTITSFLDVGQQLIVVGICLFCWRALLHRDYETLTLWLLFCLVLPLFTTAVLGFMGFGAILGLIVLVFVFRQVRSRMTVAVIGLITVYLGLSLFVTYKRDRREIRSALWTQNSVTQSIESTAGLITDFEFFSADEPTHLEAIDRRLNQNYLVGAAVEHSRMTGASADGETAMNAIYALIPRVIWPNKPIKLGGAEIAERYTGLNFASNVSIGIGKVMEFYINFGPWGIVFGYLLFGATVAYLDVRAGSALHAGNWPEFAQWFLPGLMFLKILGPLVELSVRFVAAFVLGWLVNRLIGR